MMVQQQQPAMMAPPPMMVQQQQQQQMMGMMSGQSPPQMPMQGMAMQADPFAAVVGQQHVSNVCFFVACVLFSFSPHLQTFLPRNSHAHTTNTHRCT
jgi:hypothetical protein